jgi:hypothetical protein
MATNLAIDPALLDRAVEVSGWSLAFRRDAEPAKSRVRKP